MSASTASCTPRAPKCRLSSTVTCCRKCRRPSASTRPPTRPRWKRSWPGSSRASRRRAWTPRNRRLAEALAKCGLIERSGQGMNLMFESAIRQGKALPSFASAHEVRLTLYGTVASPAFVRFIERLGEEKLKSFSTYDFIAFDHLRREQGLPKDPGHEIGRFGRRRCGCHAERDSPERPACVLPRP
ncbi:MAG: hypothetical protein IPK39_01660 [Sulfuritalea sp.]|nr:hypothetical protein [Sulfuritalea sp.]